MFNKTIGEFKQPYNVDISLEENEILHVIVKKHWIILVQTLLYTSIVIFICIGIYEISGYARIPQLLNIISVFGIIMFWIQYIFIQWINNELDILIITNKRIISYDQVNFLSRKMSQTTIDLVQEVNATTTSLLGNILQYGNLIIKTASDTKWNVSDFNMTMIAHPLETSRMIHKFIDEYRHSVDN